MVMSMNHGAQISRTRDRPSRQPIWRSQPISFIWPASFLNSDSIHRLTRVVARIIGPMMILIMIEPASDSQKISFSQNSLDGFSPLGRSRVRR